jgi:gamma-glutamylcyclotransferase (GGCT)/AIG2-like uncharacterized protein YtfP
MASVRLFVYGSLKRGGRHHKELNSKRAVFLGEVEARPGYRLERLPGPDGYLALVDGRRERERDRDPDPDQGPTPETEARTATVKGELFELDELELPALDHFEGEDYVRGEVHLVRGPGQKLEESALALAYFKQAR